MKKLFYLLMALLISQNLLAQTKTWTGTTSTDWNTASNWLPNGVPNASNAEVVIENTTNKPIVNGTVPAINVMYMNTGAILTVASGGALTVNQSNDPSYIIMQGVGSSIINNGTISVGAGIGGFGIVAFNSASITNRGTINTNNTNGIISQSSGNLTILNESAGIINSDVRSVSPAILNITNRGTINYSGGNNAISFEGASNASTLTNNGTVNITAGNGILNPSGSTITNNACGKILMSSIGSYNNGGTTTNAGLIQATNTISQTGTFTNNGVLKYGSLSGTVTNSGNGAVIVKDSPTPIFTYGGTYNGTVNGIFTNAAATTLAGTFTAPNTFTPSGSLPTGSQTLYAKITPSGGACNYVVGFTYNNVVPPTLTAGAVTNVTTCGGATGSIAFTTTNVPNGTYALTFTTTGTSSPKNVTVSGNAFTLSGVTAGNYNNFSLTVSGQTATTGVLNPAKTVANPPSPTLTAGTVTNPTTCGGTGSIAFTTTNLPNGTYSLTYTGTGSPKSITVSANAFSLTGLTAGSYSNFSVTNAGCTGSVATTKTLTNPATPTLTAGTVTNPTTCGGTGSIAFTSTNLPNGTYTLNYTLNGSATSKSITVSTNSFSLTGITVGVYNNFATTNNGCTSNTVTTSRTLTSPTIANPTGVSASSTLLCGEQSVSLSANCGVNTATWYNQATGGTALGTGSPFLQSPKITTTFFAACNNGNCESNRIATSQVVVNRGIGGNNVPYTDDSSVLPNFLFYNKYTTSSAMTVDSVSVLVNNGPDGSLIGDARIKIAIYSDNAGNPQTLLASSDANANTATPSLVKGLNRFKLNSAVNLPCGTYWIAYVLSSAEKIAANYNNGEPVPLSDTKYSSFAFGGAFPTTNNLTKSPNGFAYNVYFSGYLDCALPTPSNVLPTTTAICSGSSITLSGTCSTGSITWYTVSSGGISIGSGTGLIVNPTNSTTYYAACKNGGCEGRRIATGLITVNPIPTISAGTVVNPATCGSTGSIPFMATNLSNGTYSLSFTATGAGATASPRNVIVTSNAFSLTGLSVGSYSNFSLTSTGCTASDATAKSISNPTTPTLTAGVAVNPTECRGTDGSIPFTTNLPDGTYSLSYTGTGSPKFITVNSGAFTLGSLSSGGYNNFSVTNNGCIGTANTPRSLSDPAAPVLTLGTTSNPTACNLSDGSIAFTTTNITDGTYSFTYTGAGSPQNITIASGAFTLSGLADGSYSNFSITNESGCTGSVATSVTLVDLALPVLTVGTSTNPTTCFGTEGTIAFTSANLPNGTYSLSFTSTGTASPKSITVASNAFTLNGLSAGSYSNFSVTNTGCTGTVATLKTLSNPPTPSLSVGTSINPTTCSGTDGTIAFTTTNLPNGVYSLSFNTTGTTSPKNVTITNNAFTLDGLSAGNYTNFAITNNGCTANNESSRTLMNPPTPTISAGLVSSPSTCSSADGSIAFMSTDLPDGSYTLSYTGTGSPKTVNVTSNSFSLTGLDNGTYSNFTISYLGCTASDATAKTVNSPSAPTLTAGLATNPTTCASNDGTIAFTTSLPNGTYIINYTGAGSPQTVTVTSGAFTLTGLPDGTFSGFSVTTGSCTGTSSATKTLTDPAAPTLTAGTATNPSTCLSTDGSIAFTTSLPNGTYSLSYTGSGSPQNITVSSGAFTLGNLPDGTFSGFSVTTGGCTGTSSATKTLTDPAAPTLTAGTISNPTTCAGSEGSIAFTTSLPNGTYTLNYTGSGSPKSITVESGIFTLTGLSAGTYSGFSVITGGCIGLDNETKTLTDPIAPSIIAGTATNPTTCSGTDGSIAFTSTNLPNGTYSLSFTGTGTVATGSPKNITVASGAFNLTGLSAGTYSNFSVTNLGCTGTDASSKTLSDPDAPVATASSNSPICAGTALNLFAGGGSSYIWTGNGFSSTQQNPIINNATASSAGTYTVTVTNNGCTASATVTVLVNPTPTATASSNSPICAGTTLNLNATGAGAYSWSGTAFTSTEQNPSINNASATMSGIYTVSVTDNNGCVGSATVAVIVNAIPATPTPNAINPINLGASVTLTATGCAGILKWYKSSDNSLATNPVSPTETTNYYAKCEITANGITCESLQSANVTVTVISVQIIYVNIANTNPTQDGTNWATAFSDLQMGLATAGGITGTTVEVWVAKGTYKPTTTTTRTIYFNVPSGVKIYGGFMGTETALIQRDVKTNSVILSGDIGTINLETDNSYHVIVFDGSSNTTALDGFTITGGYANFDPRRVYFAPNSITTSTVTIETGGGIAIQNMGKPTISNCTIIRNSGVLGGGIFVGDASTPTISACKFMGNQAGFGAGLYFQDGSNGIVINSLISGNKGIGAIYNNTSNSILMNCTLAGNGGYNGGIFNSNSQPVVKNSIIWGNSTPFNDTQSIITNSLIQGGYSGIGNLNYDPQFVSQTPEGLSPNTTGDYHIKANSLAIDRGNNGSISLTELDLDGNLRRFVGGIVDMGAYEFQGNASAVLVISVQTGNWETNSTWDVGRVPQLGDYVIINSNHIVTINGEGTAKNVEYRNNGIVRFGSNTAKLNIGF